MKEITSHHLPISNSLDIQKTDFFLPAEPKIIEGLYHYLLKRAPESSEVLSNLEKKYCLN